MPVDLSSRDELLATAGEYVLGTLDAAEMAEVERVMRSNGELTRAVAEWQDKLAALNHAVEAVPPAPQLWVRIESNLPPARASNTATQSTRAGFWESLNFWRLTSAVAFAASLLLAVLLVRQPAIDTAPTYTAVLQTPEKSAGWIVQVTANKQVRVTPLVNTSVGPKQALELWTLIDKAKGPVSLGLIPPDRVTTIPFERLPGLGPDQLFEITLEPETGSPIGRPTGPVLFIGRTVKAI